MLSDFFQALNLFDELLKLMYVYLRVYLCRWGYTSYMYVAKRAPQMAGVKDMLDRIVSWTELFHNLLLVLEASCFKPVYMEL